LNDIIDSVVRDQVSGSELVELVRSASWEVPEGEVLEEVPAEVREELTKAVTRGREEITRTILTEARRVIPQYGIELVDVRIKRLNYVESVREKVYARMISERKRIAAKFRSEGEGRSAEILGTMEKELRQIRSTAYRRVQETRGKADAEATKVYGAAFSRDPEFYTFSRTLEAYKEGQNKNSTLILTTDADYYRTSRTRRAGRPVRPAPRGSGRSNSRRDEGARRDPRRVSGTTVCALDRPHPRRSLWLPSSTSWSKPAWASASRSRAQSGTTPSS